jgi:hypothetical protein
MPFELSHRGILIKRNNNRNVVRRNIPPYVVEVKFGVHPGSPKPAPLLIINENPTKGKKSQEKNKDFKASSSFDCR